MATVELGWREVAVPPLVDGGLPVLDHGLGRLIAPAEAELLEVGTDHAERPPTISLVMGLERLRTALRKSSM